jgi:hypothetical protein
MNQDERGGRSIGDEKIRIELTDEQRKQIKEASGRDITFVEMELRELEQRIAPFSFGKV